MGHMGPSVGVVGRRDVRVHTHTLSRMLTHSYTHLPAFVVGIEWGVCLGFPHVSPAPRQVDSVDEEPVAYRRFFPNAGIELNRLPNSQAR